MMEAAPDVQYRSVRGSPRALDHCVAASTQNQALSALFFLGSDVLEVVVRPKRPARVPLVLTREEVRAALLRHLDGVPRSWPACCTGPGSGYSSAAALAGETSTSRPTRRSSAAATAARTVSPPRRRAPPGRPDVRAVIPSDVFPGKHTRIGSGILLPTRSWRGPDRGSQGIELSVHSAPAGTGPSSRIGSAAALPLAYYTGPPILGPNSSSA